MLPPRPNPNLRLMPQLMPGTHTTVTVIPDTTVHTADITVVDGVNTMVDITGTLAMNRYWKNLKIHEDVCDETFFLLDDDAGFSKALERK